MHTVALLVKLSFVILISCGIEFWDLPNIVNLYLLSEQSETRQKDSFSIGKGHVNLKLRLEHYFGVFKLIFSSNLTIFKSYFC